MTIRVLKCPRHDPPLLVYPPMLRTLVPPLRIFGFDLLVAIGLLRWGLHYQRREVQLLLEARGIEISEGEISALGTEFLLRFYLLHRSRTNRIRHLLASGPGQVFHADGTMDQGSEVVFTVMEGLTGIVLDSFLLPHEGRAEVAGALRAVKERFGVPHGLVRDFATNVRDAMDEVFPGVPQGGCHVHFVRVLGSKLFDGSYGPFRNQVLDTRALARLLDLGRRVAADAAGGLLERAVNAWISCEIAYLEEPRQRPSRYPFELPYLECVSRALRVEKRVRRVVRALGARDVSLRHLRDLDDLLGKALLPAVGRSYPKLAKAEEWYGQARDALRLSRASLSASEPPAWRPTREARAAYLEALARIEGESVLLGEDYRGIAGIIRRVSGAHVEELFAEVRGKDGKELPFRRENNLQESCHRWSRMNIRRRTGRGKTAREMALYGPLLAVFSNLFNEEYVEGVLGDVGVLARELQAFPQVEVEALRERMRGGVRGRAPSMEASEWEERSEELVGILEGSGEVAGAALQGWLKKVQGEALTED